MRVRKGRSAEKKCAECIHEYACALWHVGTIHFADASGCGAYETVKDSAAYFLGRMDGRNETASGKAMELFELVKSFFEKNESGKDAER